jgi:hypothetical protein
VNGRLILVRRNALEDGRPDVHISYSQLKATQMVAFGLFRGWIALDRLNKAGGQTVMIQPVDTIGSIASQLHRRTILTFEWKINSRETQCT